MTMPLPDDVFRRMSIEPEQPNKAKQRSEIENDVQAFLARGGEINRVDPRVSQAAKQPIKRTRKEQIKWKKRFGKEC